MIAATPKIEIIAQREPKWLKEDATLRDSMEALRPQQTSSPDRLREHAQDRSRGEVHVRVCVCGPHRAFAPGI